MLIFNQIMQMFDLPHLHTHGKFVPESKNRGLFSPPSPTGSALTAYSYRVRVDRLLLQGPRGPPTPTGSALTAYS